jgi:hypothetical protein
VVTNHKLYKQIKSANKMSIIHEIKGHEAASLMSILYSTNGFYTGDIIFDMPIRPEMGLSDSLDQQNESYKLFDEQVIRTVVARYGAIFDTPMVVLSKMFAVGRYPTREEIEHDIDHFNSEQVLFSKKYYSKLTGIPIKDIDPTLPRYRFPKGSWMGPEQYIYNGPMRMEYAQCATFIDRYPLRTSVEYMIDTVEGLKRTEEKLGKDKMVGDGGFLVDIAYKGTLHPLRWQRSSPFPEGEPEDVPIPDSSYITPEIIEKAYKGLERYANENKDSLDEHIEMIKEDFVEKWPYTFHHGSREFRDGYIDMVQDEAEHTEKWYLQFYDRWKEVKKK